MTARPRVLFVDDEEHVLDSLRDLLRRHRRRWDMVFAPGGAAAIAALDAEPFDVVVSDMRMPGVDGAAVLAHARMVCPRAVRVMLSGFTEHDAAARAAAVADRVLTKPCEVGELEAAIDGALAGTGA